MQGAKRRALSWELGGLGSGGGSSMGSAMTPCVAFKPCSAAGSLGL